MPETPDDLEAEKLLLEQRRTESDIRLGNENLRLDEARLKLEEARVKMDQRFIVKYFAALLVFTGTVLTIGVSVVQIKVAQDNNAAALALQKQRNAADLDLARRNADASTRTEMMKFVTSHETELSSGDETIRTRYRGILKATFPELADAWLQLLTFEQHESVPQPSSTATKRGAPINADWAGNVEWSIQDRGPVDCPSSYVAAPECIYGGGRSCLMQRAISAAKAGNFEMAYQLTLVTQCHNPTAQQIIRNAGTQAIGAYLRNK